MDNSGNHRAVIQQNTEGIQLQLIPQHLKLIIYTPGNGKNPLPGHFIIIRHKTYLEDESIISQQRKTFVRGRGRLIEGLELGLSMVNEGMKGRFIISSKYAYKNIAHKKIPPNSTIIMDFEVISIIIYPSCYQVQQQDFLIEVASLSKSADNDIAKGDWISSLASYKHAMCLLQNYKIEKEKQKYEKLIVGVIMKAVEVGVVVGEYYDVIMWAYRLLQYPGMQKSPRCLMSRARAYTQIGEFNLAENDLKDIIMLYPHHQFAKKELNRTLIKKKQAENQGFISFNNYVASLNLN